MYQCIKQFGSIKTGSFWDVDRYVVNSDGERRKVIITNEDNWLLLSMADFENHFAEANEPLTEQEWLQTANTEQLAEVLFSWYKLGRLDVINKHTEVKKDWLIEHLEQPHTS